MGYLRLQPPFGSMVLSTSILLSSRPTWCHTHVSTSRLPHTLQSSQLRRPTTSSCLLLRSQTLVSSQLTRWSSVTLVTVNTWLAACCTAVTSSPRTSTPLLHPLRPSEPSSSSTGVPPVSRSVSTTNRQPWSQEVILPRYNVLCAC